MAGLTPPISCGETLDNIARRPRLRCLEYTGSKQRHQCREKDMAPVAHRWYGRYSTKSDALTHTRCLNKISKSAFILAAILASTHTAESIVQVGALLYNAQNTQLLLSNPLESSLPHHPCSVCTQVRVQASFIYR